MNTEIRRTGIAAIALGATLGLAACGSSNSSTAADAGAAAPSSNDTSMAADPAAQTFGSACGAVPKSGPGSFTGMATAPVASAASANPVLSTLVTAVKKAGLGDTLHSPKAITVFAPTQDAVSAIPPQTPQGGPAGKAGPAQ